MLLRTAVADDLPVLRDIYRRASLSNTDDAAALLARPHFLVLPEAEVLVEDAVTRLRRDGAVRLEVVANPHASCFYGAVGFERDGEVPMELGVGIRMHLDL